jgi:hypothetical protein
MDETLALSGTMDFERDYPLPYDAFSDEDLELAGQGLQASWGTAGGWMSSTQQCCSPHDL